MKELIQLDSFSIQTTLKILLEDKTTKKNIIWATNSYQSYGEKYSERSQITIDLLNGLNSIDIQPRVLKSRDAQHTRTKKRAEVFTPSWICNQMNNYCDDEWFGKKNVFNIQNEDHVWKSKRGKIGFPKSLGKTWKDYILSTRLEITCGEAPYLVSRYDTTTGEFIKLNTRIGMLDRKFRVINENTSSEEEWFEWVIKAYQSTYGYEFQGDNLLIARINLLLTFVDNYIHKWNKEPSKRDLRKIAHIISWNIWQMDGLTYQIPLGGELIENSPEIKEEINLYSQIKDWTSRNGKTIYFKDLRKENK